MDEGVHTALKSGSSRFCRDPRQRWRRFGHRRCGRRLRIGFRDVRAAQSNEHRNAEGCEAASNRSAEYAGVRNGLPGHGSSAVLGSASMKNRRCRAQSVGQFRAPGLLQLIAGDRYSSGSRRRLAHAGGRMRPWWRRRRTGGQSKNNQAEQRFHSGTPADSISARAPHAVAQGGSIQQVLGFDQLALLSLDLRGGQANSRCNSVPGDDFRAAIEDLIATSQHRIPFLDEAGIDVAGRRTCRGGRVVRRVKGLRHRLRLSRGFHRRFSGAWCARACRRQGRNDDQSNRLDFTWHSSPFVSVAKRPRRAAL